MDIADSDFLVERGDVINSCKLNTHYGGDKLEDYITLKYPISSL